MRISHFCSSMEPSRGGIAKGVFLIASNLTNFGIKSEVLSLGNLKSKLETHLEIQNNMNSIGVTYNFTLSKLRNDYGIGSLKVLKLQMDSMPKPNVVILHQVYTLSTFFGYRYAKRRRIPFAVFPHGSLTKYHETDNKLIKEIAKKLFFLKILRNADSIIVTCTSEKDDLDPFLQKKAIVLPYGTNFDITWDKTLVKPNYNKKLDRIIFSGRFDKKKNLPIVLKAMPQIMKTFPDLVLDIAGSGSRKEVKKIEDLILELKLEKNVRLLGWINESKMQELFSTARLLVLPSENENFALVVSEALSAGVPCVVSKYVGTAEIVAKHQAGVVIDELTPASVAEGILKVLHGDEDRYQKSALKAVETSLNWSQIALQWRGLIESLT